MLYCNSHGMEDIKMYMDVQSKDKVKIAIGFILALTMWCIAMSACAAPYYVGAHATALDSRFKEGFGKETYSRVTPLVGGLLGVQFNETVGLEVDMDMGLKRKSQTLVPGPRLPGVPPAPNNYQTIHTQTSTKSVGAGMRISRPIGKTLHAFGVVGAHHFQVNAKQYLMFDGAVGIPTPNEITESTRTFKKRKIIPFCKVGVQKMIEKDLSLSVFATWREMSRFKIKPAESLGSDLRLKDSFGAGVSLGFHF